jgi:hypothetical protein
LLAAEVTAADVISQTCTVWQLGRHEPVEEDQWYFLRLSPRIINEALDFAGYCTHTMGCMYGPRFGTLSVSSQIMQVRSDRALLMHTDPQKSHIVG